MKISTSVFQPVFASKIMHAICMDTSKKIEIKPPLPVSQHLNRNTAYRHSFSGLQAYVKVFYQKRKKAI